MCASSLALSDWPERREKSNLGANPCDLLQTSAGCLILKFLEEEVFASVIFNHCFICSNSSCNLSSIRDGEILIYLLLLFLMCIIFFFFPRELWQVKVGMNILSIYSSAKALRFVSDIVLLEFWKIFRVELANTLKPLCFLMHVGVYDEQEKLMSETLHSSCKKKNAGGIQCSETNTHSTLFCHAGMRISSMQAVLRKKLLISSKTLGPRHHHIVTFRQGRTECM